MYITTVIPISRGVLREHLSYYTSQKLQEGSVVWVPVRTREIPALVVSTEPAQMAKAAIKDAGFQMKKVRIGRSRRVLSPIFIETVKKTAGYFLSTSGSVLHSLVPKAIFEQPDTLTDGAKLPLVSQTPESLTKGERLVLQADEDERFSHYRNLIREEFARGKSIFFCAPTIQEVHYLAEQIGRGVEPYAFSLHSALSKKEVYARWNGALGMRHPVVIIATGSFLSLPRSDISTYVIEHESSRFYKLPARPYVDIRTFADFLAEENKARVIFADLLLRVETLYQYKNGTYDEAAPLKMRALHKAQTHLIDMRPAPKGTNLALTSTRHAAKDRRQFEVLSPEMLSYIENAIEQDRHAFLFSSRRGLSPLTVCEDCGTVVSCSACSAPATLHRRGDENIFLCHKCGNERTALERCITCTSWKLKALGIGTQRVLEAIRDAFPDVPLFAIESGLIRSHKQAQTIAQSFYATPGSVLVGTEMSLPYLTKPIAVSGVASMDSLLSLPEIRISERAMYLLLFLASRTDGDLFVQTRKVELPLLTQALQGNIADFYRTEIADRETLSYPPFTTLIKCTATGSKADVEKELQGLTKALEDFDFAVYPAFTHTVRGKYTAHGLLKIPQWPDKMLASILSRTSPSVSINVSPEEAL